MSLLIAIGVRDAARMPPFAVVTNAAIAAKVKMVHPAEPINFPAANDIGKELSARSLPSTTPKSIEMPSN